jgi:hypothetical protein
MLSFQEQIPVIDTLPEALKLAQVREGLAGDSR